MRVKENAGTALGGAVEQICKLYVEKREIQ